MTMAGAPPSPPREPVETYAYEQIRATGEYRQLRRRRRSVSFTATAVILTVYLGNVLLANEARDLMSSTVAGHTTVGLALGLAVCMAVPLAAWWYQRRLATDLDPLADQLAAALKYLRGHR
ncbi:DUF485 domain-containing protein [Streptomyces cupreus]|uniref:DUF485 domain-containing protein n=1 Tax=Streptomyces cupreus TaxID=2759956 RepID=A0A7X1MBH8_9ACTN|nr:DUF485 domain-containing protein [Streptomyces cupreus]MBC2904823.1 DUF485 domain-containing protein [Streptomyces cupreus]